MKTTLFLFCAIFVLSAKGQDKIDQLLFDKSYDKALVLIDRRLSSEPTASLFFRKGLALKGLYDYSGSLEALNKAVLLDYTNIGYLMELAELSAIVGNSTDAIGICRKALSLSPNDVTIRARLGQWLIAQREFFEAHKIFSDLRGKDTTNLLFNKNLAFSSARLGKVKEAISLFEGVITQNPRDMSSYLTLASLYEQDKSNEKSNATLIRGLGEFPDNSVLQLRLAQNYYNQHKFGEAVSAYDIWLKKNQINASMRKEYGIVLYFNKMEEKALEVLEVAVAEVPNDPIPAFYAGLCLKKLKDFDLSKQYLHLAIESATPYYLGDIFHQLAQVHGQMREFEKSLECLQKAYDLDPTDHEILFEMATTYEEFNSNKTLAYNYYHLYLTQAKESAQNSTYALNRMQRIKEDMFFEGKK